MERTSYESRRRLESLDRPALEVLQLARLNKLLDRILPENSFYNEKLSNVSRPVSSLQELQSWPLTTKDELVPHDGTTTRSNHLTFPTSDYVRYHQTSGTHGRPLVVLDTIDDWRWWTDTWQFVLDGANLTEHDVVAMAFSFGPFIGFWSANDAIVSRGSLVMPGGGLSSEARLEMILSQQATVVCCTPSYALHLASVAEQTGLQLEQSHVRVVIVAGEPGGSVPAVRQRIESAWGAKVIDHAGASEVGPWGYGCGDQAGLHIVESEFIAEYLRIDTGEPAETGEIAELVLTSLGRVGAPVIRYRTGDLVEPHMESNDRNRFVFLKDGVLGRVDDMMIVRGVNIYPSAIEQILREFAEVREFRMTVTKQGEMDVLSIEVEDSANDPGRIEQALRVRLGLKIDVRSVDDNALPRFEMKGRRFVDLREGS